MTESEFTAASASGSIQADTADAGDQGGAAAPATPSIDISQFIPLLMQLQSVQLCVSAAPTYIPQTFQEQIVFVFDGSNYYLYLYFNNQWNEFPISGGGGGGVTEVLAGSGISLSGATGNVTITCTVDDATLNSDSTTDSICMKCFQTIAKKPTSVGSFVIEEQEHQCDPLVEWPEYAHPPRGTF